MKHKTETLVIGGGAIGICCAYYLHGFGKNVTVVEKDDICSGSSYGNAGLIVFPRAQMDVQSGEPLLH